MNEASHNLFNYCLRIADSNLILSHRLSEWCGHGPVLEEDIALTNISLDLLGQATHMYQYAAKVEGLQHTEDDLVYFRDERAYKNYLLCEQPNGNYADTIARQFMYDVFHYYFLEALVHSTDEYLSGYAEKSIKEVRYHLKHSTLWILRLGDGTDESHQKIQEAFNNLWMFSGELFEEHEDEKELLKQGVIPDMLVIKQKWTKHLHEVLQEATLQIPKDTWMQTGGTKGVHTEHLGYILADLQYLRRAYPTAKEW